MNTRLDAAVIQNDKFRLNMKAPFCLFPAVSDGVADIAV